MISASSIRQKRLKMKAGRKKKKGEGKGEQAKEAPRVCKGQKVI
jgi:hypothetical protein